MQAGRMKFVVNRVSLTEQLDISKDVQQKIASIPKSSGVVIKEKFNHVFTKNDRLQFWKEVNEDKIPATLNPEEHSAHYICSVDFCRRRAFFFAV